MVRALGVGQDKWVCDTCKVASSTSSKSIDNASTTPISQEFFVRTMNEFKTEVFKELINYNSEESELRLVEYLSSTVDTVNKLISELREELNQMKRENEAIEKVYLDEWQLPQGKCMLA